MMERERERFIDGAKKNGVNDGDGRIDFREDRDLRFVRLQPLARRRLCADHLHTAYLKAHYPHEFMAALMSLDMDDTGKSYKNIAALREMRIAILPPDVNQSRVKFTVTGEAIRFGLGAIRGVGSQDRARRLSPARALGGVQESGGFLHAGRHRPCQPARARRADQVRRLRFERVPPRLMVAQIEDALKIAQRPKSDAAQNQIGLFGKRSRQRAAASLARARSRMEWRAKGDAQIRKGNARLLHHRSSAWTNTTASCAESAISPPPTCPRRPTAARSASPA